MKDKHVLLNITDFMLSMNKGSLYFNQNKVPISSINVNCLMLEKIIYHENQHYMSKYFHVFEEFIM